MSKNRIKDYCPEAWDQYLWEQTKHEPLPACLDFAAHLVSLEPKTEEQKFSEFHMKNVAMADKLAAKIVQRSERRARKRKGQS